MRLLILILFFGLEAFANSQVFKFSKNKPLDINISSDYNRVSFSYLKINEIIGNNLRFDVLPINGSNEIVFMPKTKTGEKIVLSFISNIGLVQDITFNVLPIPPQVIEVNLPLPHQILSSEILLEEQKIDRFLNKILIGKVQLNPIKPRKIRNQNFCIKIIGDFKCREYIAHLLEVRNKTKEAKELKKEYLNFRSVLKVYIPNKFPNKKETSQAIVIVKIKDVE